MHNSLTRRQCIITNDIDEKCSAWISWIENFASFSINKAKIFNATGMCSKRFLLKDHYDYNKELPFFFLHSNCLTLALHLLHQLMCHKFRNKNIRWGGWLWHEDASRECICLLYTRKLFTWQLHLWQRVFMRGFIAVARLRENLFFKMIWMWWDWIIKKDSTNNVDMKFNFIIFLWA